MIKSTLAALCTILSVASSAHAYSFAPSKEEATKGAPELRDDVKFQLDNIKNFEGLVNSAGDKRVVLTFDDGPDPQFTKKILRTLKEKDIKATFFIMGSRVNGKAATDLLALMKKEGHIVANHTDKHPDLRKRSSDDAFDQVVSTHNKIVEYQDPKHGRYFRAPYGNWLSKHADKLNRSSISDYIGPIYWTVGGSLGCSVNNGKKQYFDKYANSKNCGIWPIDERNIYSSADWACWSKKVTIENCAKGYVDEAVRKNGGVILLHDVHMNTAEMLPVLIDGLKQQGFRFVNLDEVPGIQDYRDKVFPLSELNK